MSLDFALELLEKEAGVKTQPGTSPEVRLLAFDDGLSFEIRHHAPRHCLQFMTTAKDLSSEDAAGREQALNKSIKTNLARLRFQHESLCLSEDGASLLLWRWAPIPSAGDTRPFLGAVESFLNSLEFWNEGSSSLDFSQSNVPKLFP